MNITNSSPQLSLQEGHWVKFICGASYHFMPAIKELVLIYALAGVDCIDVAADPAVVAAARSGLRLAQQLKADFSFTSDYYADSPWLMISLNDGEDPHFRKATFDPKTCPTDCPRPCQSICPTGAIAFDHPEPPAANGVIPDLCYGCGRCIPICPVNHITAISQTISPTDLTPLLLHQIDAIEIHTQIGRQKAFQQLWEQLRPWCSRLRIMAISCPYEAGVIDYMHDLYSMIQPYVASVIWQTDGRPMSGDIGKGTTQASIRFAQQVLASELPGYVQLAGGTNQYTAEKLRTLGMLRGSRHPTQRQSQGTSPRSISGIAYGSYARKLVMPFLMEDGAPLDHPALSSMSSSAPAPDGSPTPSHTTLSLPDPIPRIASLENNPAKLRSAVLRARYLVAQLKQIPSYS